MSIKFAGAPCCWGVDDPKNPYLPPWELVLKEASQAGYKGIELGPYGYIPMEIERVKQELTKNDLTIIAGTIFDDLVSEGNLQNLLNQVDEYYSKMDPEKWLRDYADRLDYIHFKDIDEEIYQEVMGEHIRFFDACAKGVMCPIGQGIIDYPSLNQLLKEINYQGYITIEQERDPRNADTSLRDISQSLTYLKSVGY